MTWRIPAASLGGLRVARHLREECPDTKALALTVHERERPRTVSAVVLHERRDDLLRTTARPAAAE
jgi:hypothetical protein